VVLIPGDGTGPELVVAARQVIDAAAVAVGCRLRWDVRTAGAAAVGAGDDSLPPDTLAALRDCGVALKGPLSTPVGTGFRSVNLRLRRELDLYACLRPCRSRIGVRTGRSDVDLVIVRENVQDVYAGLELEPGDPAVADVVALVPGLREPEREGTALTVRPISVPASERICRFAFDYAARSGRHAVACGVDLARLPRTDGAFLAGFRAAARSSPGPEAREYDLSDLCGQLVAAPAELDVVVLANLYGDVLSDVAAALTGGLGLAPSANLGPAAAVFEATHGSAPRFAGSGRLNPTALILAGALLLAHLGETEAAALVDRAVDEVLAAGRSVTADVLAAPEAPAASTEEYAAAVVDRLGRVAS
jgi:isocitrate dehydrogenase (NAD+)